MEMYMKEDSLLLALRKILKGIKGISQQENEDRLMQIKCKIEKYIIKEVIH